VEALLGEQNGWERFYLSRRDFIRYSLATGVAEWAGSTIPAGLGISRAEAQELFEVDATRSPEKVFPQSVASGDPQPRGIVLWTRVNSKIARRGANLARVAYEISESEDFSNPILQGVAETNPSRDYTVKVQLDSRSELEPFTTYYYRFIFQRTENRPGRFKTLPAASAELSSLRLGYTSCQDYTNGYYHALRFLADEQPELDYVLHLGDYVYETVDEESFQRGQVRTIKFPDGGTRAKSLKDYRYLYKTYKKDPDLQHLHERYATIHIWDDHEFANDCFGIHSTDNEQVRKEAQRREAANRAWAEYIPAGVPYDPDKGPLEEIKIYRTFDFGNLAQLVMTDERLYRDGPPWGADEANKYLTEGCPEMLADDRTMLGDEQLRWFLDQVRDADQTWKVWGNETCVECDKQNPAPSKNAPVTSSVPSTSTVTLSLSIL
jgi:alkaline phosphatase D